MKVINIALATLTLSQALVGCATIRPDMLAKGAKAEEVVLKDGSTVQYMQYVPAGYHGGKAPVLIFLHGSGEAGSDVTRIMGPGPWAYARDHADFPFIILAPQQWRDEEWDPKKLKEWLDYAEAHIPADRHRLYLTGLSLGGGGAWDWGTSQPRRFAAIAPVSGYSNLKTPCKLTGNHLWAFHGETDDVVPIWEEEVLVSAAKACGIDIRYTIYPGGNHNAWDATYANPELYAWFLDHKLKIKPE
jgi:predicted peptidase